MFLDFFFELKKHGIPASLHEYLTLLEAMKEEIINYDIDEFYALSKSVFVKQEAHLDRFDVIFGKYFKAMEQIPDDFFIKKIPKEWLKKDLLRQLSEEDKAAIEKLGGLDALIERFKELLEEQRKKHSGGNKWIGTGGTSPFGAQGYHPEGFRMGGESAGNRTAIKVWDKRSYKNLDDNIELDTRNIKIALKRLRRFTREGVATELDLDDTIKKTSKNAGMLDISMVPTRKNRVKVLLLMDVGGSMDEHIRTCEKLFSAARYEFKNLEFFYFHNCVYESVWKDNRRRFTNKLPTLDLINKFGKDYKLIFVGDAAMSPYEIFYKGGSVEHYNDEAGIYWLRKLKAHFTHFVWINPNPEYAWEYYQSTQAIREFTEERMFPMTLGGITNAMRCLKNKKRKYTKRLWGE